MKKICERCNETPIAMNFNGQWLCMDCVREVCLQSEKEKFIK